MYQTFVLHYCIRSLTQSECVFVTVMSGGYLWFHRCHIRYFVRYSRPAEKGGPVLSFWSLAEDG